MGLIIPVCLGEIFGLKVLALLAVSVVVYLYWTGIKEKRAERRQRKWLEDKRREIKAKAEKEKSAPPPGS